MEEKKHERTYKEYVMLLRWVPKAHVLPMLHRL